MSNQWSSVGKKVVTGVTGFLLVGFVIAHLIGNLTLFLGDEPFNAYAHLLTSLGHGFAIYLAEVALLLFFGFHAVSGISVYLRKTEARPVAYVNPGNAGGAIRKTLSSQSMILTGAILLIFLIIHVLQFRLGAHYDIQTPTGERIRDLFRLVTEVFHNPLWVGFYVFSMALLGFHLRHGFWSMFQSLGLANRRWLPLLYGVAALFALVMAVGFAILPLYIHFAHNPQAGGPQ